MSAEPAMTVRVARLPADKPTEAAPLLPPDEDPDPDEEVGEPLIDAETEEATDAMVADGTSAVDENV